MQGRTIGAALAAMLAGCGQSQEAAPQPPPKPKAEKAPHCFFKDAEAKDWKLALEGDQAVVTGRAFRSDARYKTVLLDPKIDGRVAVVRPSIANNDTGYAAEGNWWELKASIPAAAIDTVEVRCGKKLLATLPVEKPVG